MSYLQANLTRAATQLGSAIIFGLVFNNLGYGQTHISDRLGLLQVAAINTAMSTVIKTLKTFPVEKTIVQVSW
jgi:hypothetical protein